MSKTITLTEHRPADGLLTMRVRNTTYNVNIFFNPNAKSTLDMFLNLYTDKSKGIISEQRFLKLTDAMEQEQNSNKARLSELNLLLHQSDEQESDVHAFIEEIRKYAAIKELDEVVLNRLIKKIMIGEVQKVDGQKIQEVKIIYNFVGEISA